MRAAVGRAEPMRPPKLRSSTYERKQAADAQQRQVPSKKPAVKRRVEPVHKLTMVRKLSV